MNNKAPSFFRERPLPQFEMDPQVLRRRTRRDVLLFGAGAAVAALAGAGSLLPQDTLTRLGLRRNINSPGKEWFLNKALRIDDDVARGTLLGKSFRAHLYQIADYSAQEQLQRSYSRSWVYPWMAFDFGWAGLRREPRPRYSQSHDSLLDTRADYAAGLRRRLERDCVVGWSEI